MEQLLNNQYLPLIVGIGIILALWLARSIMIGIPKEIPCTVEEARLELTTQLNWTGMNGIINEGNKLIIIFEYLPSQDLLGHIPVIFKGYDVQARLFDEKEPIRIK